MSEYIKEFVYSETLNSDAQTKTVTLLGTIRGEHAIVTLEKTAFPLDNSLLFDNLLVQDVKNLDTNDIYSWNLATLHQDLDSAPGAKVSLVYPATETHIKKHRKQHRRIVVETPQMYTDIVLPYIETQKGDRVQWVMNILHHGAEADRVVFRNDDPITGFVLLPNMKWDRRTMEALYLVAIVLRDDLGSIRDLTKSHIPFLETMKKNIHTAVYNSYGIDASQLKLYLHYQPSYYHLHIHVAHVLYEQFDFGRSLLLDNVIDQLRYLGSDGFRSATLSYVIGEGHDLWKRMKNDGDINCKANP